MKHLLRTLAAVFVAAWLLPVPAQAQFQGSMWATTGGSCTGGYTGPGDVQGSWYAWVGLRAYSCATAGTSAIDIVRASDSASCTVPTKTNGNLDVATGTPCAGATVTSFCTATTCKVSKAYDKSGNGRDFVQATDARRPTLTLGAIGSLPCMTFPGGLPGQALLSAAVAGATAVPLSHSVVVKITANDGTNPQVFGDLGAAGTGFSDVIVNRSTTVLGTVDGVTGFDATTTAGVFHALNAVSNGASSSIAIDGTTTTGTNGTGGISNTDLLGIGSGDFSNRDLKGLVCEAGLAASAFSGGTITSLNSNQHTYWGF